MAVMCVCVYISSVSSVYERQGTHTFAPVLLSDWTADTASCPSTPELNGAFNHFDVQKQSLQKSECVMSPKVHNGHFSIVKHTPHEHGIRLEAES